MVANKEEEMGDEQGTGAVGAGVPPFSWPRQRVDAFVCEASAK